MTLRPVLTGLLLVAAIVLVVLGIIATAITSGPTPGQVFGVIADSWFLGSFLSFLVSVLVGGWSYAAPTRDPVTVTRAP
jgi:hypothetical protein